MKKIEYAALAVGVSYGFFGLIGPLIVIITAILDGFINFLVKDDDLESLGFLVRNLYIFFGILAIATGCYAYYINENAHHVYNGWWIVCGYCTFLFLVHTGRSVRLRVFSRIKKRLDNQIFLFYFLNPVSIILFLVFSWVS